MEDAFCEMVEKLEITKKYVHGELKNVLKVEVCKDNVKHISKSEMILPSSDSITDTELLLNVFGVFDGHGGSSVSSQISSSLPKTLLQNINLELSKINFDPEQDFISQIDVLRVVKRSFLECDNELYLRSEKSGSTAIIMILINDHIIVANTGDSRCILSTQGVPKPMSFDHKPGNYGELLRIHQDGGYVSYSRVNGILALSRAFGDFTFKNDKQQTSKRRSNGKKKPPEEFQVTVEPEILIHTINTSKDEFVILACDGIWDCFKNKDLINFIRNLLSLGKDFDEIIAVILDECLKMANTVTGIGFDNMTIILILLFEENETMDDWYTRIKRKILDEKFGHDGYAT